MIDPALDDFLNSDDDEFFVEASNHFLDNDFNPEFTSTKKENVSQNSSEVTSSCYLKFALKPSSNNQGTSTNSSNPYSSVAEYTQKNNESKDLKSLNSSNYYSVVHSPDKDISNINTKSPNVCKSVTSVHIDSELPNISGDSKDKVTSLNVLTASNKTEKLNIFAVNASESANNDEAILTTSSNCNISTVTVNSTKLATPTNSSYINSRFTPGFTPKAKKRKFLGAAGFLQLFDGSKEETPNSPDKMLSMEVELQNIVSSQYTPEHLSLPSWQKLQSTVLSCSNLHSTAKYYSIQRVLSESSKKKLPKHMVVPVLCVLLKKFNCKGSTVISVFMDDTGEINGKIDAEVLTKYKEYLVEGTALILKKVTFLCNVLILKDQNLVSLYHPQGTEKHPQSLESILQTTEPLKPMNCECLKLSHIKKDLLKIHPYDTTNRHTPKCVNQKQNTLSSISYQSKMHNLTSRNNNTPKNYELDCIKQIQNRTNLSNSASKGVNSLISEPSISKVSINNQSMRSDEFLEQLLDEDNCMDEFDELLGNLDEKSFMEDH